MSPTHAVLMLMKSFINMRLIREQSMCNIDVNTIEARFSKANSTNGLKYYNYFDDIKYSSDMINAHTHTHALIHVHALTASNR